MVFPPPFPRRYASRSSRYALSQDISSTNAACTAHPRARTVVGSLIPPPTIVPRMNGVSTSSRNPTAVRMCSSSPGRQVEPPTYTTSSTSCPSIFSVVRSSGDGADDGGVDAPHDMVNAHTVNGASVVYAVFERLNRAGGSSWGGRDGALGVLNGEFELRFSTGVGYTLRGAHFQQNLSFLREVGSKEFDEVVVDIGVLVSSQAAMHRHHHRVPNLNQLNHHMHGGFVFFLQRLQCAPYHLPLYSFISSKMAPKHIPNGSTEAPIEVSSLPPVVGINFGNSLRLLCLLRHVLDCAARRSDEPETNLWPGIQEGLAECISNEN